MEILNNKSFIRKIIIAIVIVLSFNFVAPTISQAAKDEDKTTFGEYGGVLLGPVIDILAGICDAVMVILHVCLDENEGVIFSIGEWMVDFKEFDAGKYNMTGEASTSVTINQDDLDTAWRGKDDFDVPVIKYSPEKIFTNQVPGLDANFINPKYEGNEKSIASKLQETISKWYNTLRNLVLVLLLSVLLYVGIRMMLTSIASDKAKYKQMLMDWLIAVCLLFFLHYIMSFTMTFVDIIASGLDGISGVSITVGGKTFTTNLTGYCRMAIQYKDLGTRLIYLIFYIGLVIVTVMFTWKYMKRAITLAFLTLMAPLVTLTYPIDKMGDGKAQAFNMWLKEYIFNALLQPFHLIIYTIFLGSSLDMAVENPLYAILFLAFISPAEKMLRKFFKFDNTSSAVAGFAGGFGGAAAFNMVKGLMNKGSKGSSQGKNDGSVGNGSSGRQQVRTSNQNGPNGLNAFLPNGENSGDEVSERDRIKSELDNINNMRNDPEYQTDEWKKYLDEEEKNVRASDQRTLGEYGRDLIADKWNNTRLGQDMKEHMGYLNDIRMSGKNWRKNKVNAFGNKHPHLKNTIKGFKGVIDGAAPGAIRFTRKLAGAAVMGTVGLGMGIAGDDLEDVFKYGMAGAALGYTAGPTLTDNVISGINSVGEQTRYNYEAGIYGEEEATQMQNDRQFMSNQNNRDSIAKQWAEQNGSEPTRMQLNQAMQVAAEYNRSGITDIKQINKSMILEKQLEDELRKSPRSMSEKEITRSARDQAMTIAHMANELKPNEIRDPKERKKVQDRFARELMDMDKSMSPKAAEAQASRIMGMVMQMKK